MTSVQLEVNYDPELEATKATKPDQFRPNERYLAWKALLLFFLAIAMSSPLNLHPHLFPVEKPASTSQRSRSRTVE